MDKIPFEWSESAEQNYYDTIDYILEEFGVTAALNFVDKVEAVVELIRINHNLFPIIKDDVHRCVVSKQSSLTYKREDNMISILSFYANRTDHRFYFE